jgi:hypothetical protein
MSSQSRHLVSCGRHGHISFLVFSFMASCSSVASLSLFIIFPFKHHFFLYGYGDRSRDSSVGIATGYGLEGREVGVRVPVRSRIFFSPAIGPTQPPIQWVSEAVSSGIKRPGREADHSPPTSAEVKKTWIYTFTPPHVFMA